MPQDNSLRHTRAAYSATVAKFLRASVDEVLGEIARHTPTVDGLQRNAWHSQIVILQNSFSAFPDGSVYFEFTIPRIGRKVDVVLIWEGIVFVIEFKVGAELFSKADIRQVEGYAVDVKNFHKASHALPIVPILVATQAVTIRHELSASHDDVYAPLLTNSDSLSEAIVLATTQIEAEQIHAAGWYLAPYSPTPTIVEAATYLYANHNVRDIAQSGAAANNLALTSTSVQEIVEKSRTSRRKSICFVTGVPGAGKTLVGLDIATASGNELGPEGFLSVYLSGNGPLVAVLREALARDQSHRDGVPKKDARRKVERFIQNIHHFRDDALVSTDPPPEHVAVFDEAQRAWDRDATSKFMRQKKGQPNFDQSEPEFLIGYMDRHDDWCVIVALIGGGQEINSGEAGLPGWYDALDSSYADWDVYFSRELHQIEFDGGKADFSQLTAETRTVQESPGLHLSTSMRSFRAERLSHMVHHLIDNNAVEARRELDAFRSNYSIRVTRDLMAAKEWVSTQARGFESYGLLASSGGLRLRPDGIQVKNSLDPAVWFLNDSNDVRSSYFLEAVATEFDVQGLELDWALVAWDADFRHTSENFEHFDFTGTSWNRRKAAASKQFLENAYRVLLTRARQGMVIFVPNGDPDDRTRSPEFYQATYDYLRACGIQAL